MSAAALALAAFVAAAAAAATPPPPPPLVVGEREIEGVRCLEVIAGGAGADDALPLVLALHPQGGAPIDFARLVAAAPGRARIVAPYADPANGVFSWYRGGSTDRGAPGVRRAARRLLPVLASLARERPARGRPIVVGYSQGAIVAYALAAMAPARLAWVLPLAGRLPPALIAELGPPPPDAPRPRVVAFHGAADRTVPTAADAASVRALAAAGFDATLHTYDGLGHGIDAAELADFVAALAQAVALEDAAR